MDQQLPPLPAGFFQYLRALFANSDLNLHHAQLVRQIVAPQHQQPQYQQPQYIQPLLQQTHIRQAPRQSIQFNPGVPSGGGKFSIR